MDWNRYLIDHDDDDESSFQNDFLELSYHNGEYYSDNHDDDDYDDFDDFDDSPFDFPVFNRFQSIKVPADIEHNCLSENVIVAQNVDDELKKEQCRICLDTLGEPQNDSTHLFVHRTPSANHTFHLVCFLMTRKTKCPLCNQDIIKPDHQRSDSSPTISLNIGLIIKLVDFNLIKVCDQVFTLLSKTFHITLNYFLTKEIDFLDEQSQFMQLIRYLIVKQDFDYETKGDLLREIIHEFNRVSTPFKQVLYSAIAQDLNLVSRIVNLTPSRIDYYMSAENDGKSVEMRNFYDYLVAQNNFRRINLTNRILENFSVFLIITGSTSYSKKIIDSCFNDQFRSTPNYMYSLIQTANGVYNADVLTIVLTQNVVEKILAAPRDYNCVLNAVFAAKTHHLSLVWALRSCLRVLDQDTIDKISNTFSSNSAKNPLQNEWDVFRTIFDGLEKSSFRTKLISQAEIFFDYEPFYAFLRTKWTGSEIDRKQLIQHCMKKYDMNENKINFIKRVVGEIIDADDAYTLGMINFLAVRCDAKTIVQAVNSRLSDEDTWALERSLLLTMQMNKFDLFRFISARMSEESQIFGECLLEDCFDTLSTQFQREIFSRQSKVTEELSYMRLKYLEKICRTYSSYSIRMERLSSDHTQLIRKMTFKHQQLLYQHSVSYNVTPFLDELEKLNLN